MKLLTDSEKLRESLINSHERSKFDKYFSGNRNFDSMPVTEVSLPNRKSVRKNNTIWRDFEIAGKLLYCDSGYIYYECLKAEKLQDVWLEEIEPGKYKFNSLSGLTDDQASESIPKIRDFLQQWINEKYGYWVVINWSCKENIDKPDFELLNNK